MDWEKLSLVILDKALIGVLILIVGLWINRKLHQYKIGLEENVGTRVRIAERRLPSYRKLWEITQSTSRARTSELSQEDRQDLYTKLWQWYYDEGSGIFLSHQTRDLYIDARECLLRADTSEDDITDTFSSLRSKVKKEIGIYG